MVLRPAALVATVAALLMAPSALAADFNDTNFHEVILFEWDTAHLDVLIVPPVSPAAVWRLGAIEQAIDAWETGLDSDSDLDGVDIVRYTLGSAALPPAGFEMDDPDIIV